MFNCLTRANTVFDQFRVDGCEAIPQIFPLPFEYISCLSAFPFIELLFFRKFFDIFVEKCLLKAITLTVPLQ